ncbi:antiviral RADAR system adenosine deaminase RdrB [Photobacterium leiognathi]|uniref:antiviral RADAR system adenosine deaminase RdrB n=1 Tax=Photobacterium leiognathi TaxID=553611 RepID=UPI002981D860|nr:antiviral RADAR system adenosine deaminase RdrB [Photobacterium leiognathi]
MLNLSLELITYASFLSSDRALCNDESLPVPEFSHHGLKDYQARFGGVFRTDDMENMVEYLELKDKTIPEVLSHLAEYFLTWYGNRFEVKPEKIDEWSAFLTVVDSHWVVAQAYVDLMLRQNSQPSIAISQVVLNQCPIALSQNPKHKKFADNHLHLGGHGGTGCALFEFALFFEKTDNSLSWPYRSEYVMFESDRLAKDRLPYWVNGAWDKLCYSFLNDADEMVQSQTGPILLDEASLHNCHRTLGIVELEGKQDQVFLALALQYRDQPGCWLLFCIYVLYIMATKQEEYERLNALFNQCVRLSNILRNYMVVSGIGLNQFVDFFQFKLRKSSSSDNSNAFKHNALKHDSDNVAHQYRISPDVFWGTKKAQFGSELIDMLVKLQKYKRDDVHFVAHFTRGGDRKDKLQRSKRNRLRKTTERLQSFLSSVDNADSSVEDLTENGVNKYHFDLRKVLRGFDVAGDENKLPIEVFAPALRVLRSSKFQTFEMFSTHIERQFITVHAGEDFNCLLSGLRSIDEAVVFCDYHSGDRIGHGLALGMNPKVWAQKQQVAIVPLVEHLDNLVWCYQRALDVSKHTSVLLGILPHLEQKIRHWSKEAYDEEYSPYDLYQAWILRRNCPLKSANVDTNTQGTSLNQNVLDEWVIDYEQVANTASTPFRLWQRYLDSQKKGSERFYKLIKVSLQSDQRNGAFPYKQAGYYQDTVSPAELDLYEAIQDYLMELYARKGIILEACPTSNIYLQRFEYYHQHPIYRWWPPQEEWLNHGEAFNRFGIRNGAIPVCVNTDDSALMPTTIRNEHHVLEQVAIEHFNIGVNQAKQWIEEVRLKGLECYDNQHLCFT